MGNKYEYEPYIDARTVRNPAGYIVWLVEPSLSGQAGPTRTSMGYFRDIAECLKYYPTATPRL